MLIFMDSDSGRGGEGGGYLSTLPSPDAASICKYLPTVVSGIYVKVTAPEPAARLFRIRVELDEMDQASVLERGRRVFTPEQLGCSGIKCAARPLSLKLRLSLPLLPGTNMRRGLKRIGKLHLTMLC